MAELRTYIEVKEGFLLVRKVSQQREVEGIILPTGKKVQTHFEFVEVCDQYMQPTGEQFIVQTVFLFRHPHVGDGEPLYFCREKDIVAAVGKEELPQ